MLMFASVELDQSLQGLLSFERLDRASPDLWPEQSESRFVDLVALLYNAQFIKNFQHLVYM